MIFIFTQLYETVISLSQAIETNRNGAKRSIAQCDVRNIVEHWGEDKSDNCFTRRIAAYCPQSYVFSGFGHREGIYMNRLSYLKKKCAREFFLSAM